MLKVENKRPTSNVACPAKVVLTVAITEKVPSDKEVKREECDGDDEENDDGG